VKAWLLLLVIPAQAGIALDVAFASRHERRKARAIPAFAGMTI
jgi:hypothetical protein